MTQNNIQTTKEITLLGKESAFGTLPATMKPLIVESDSWEADQTRKQLEDMDSSTRLFDSRSVVDGSFEGSGKFKMKFRPYASAITASVPLSQPAAFDMLECVLGGMHVGIGASITAGTTSSVTVNDNSGFEVGQVIGLQSNGAVHIAVVTDKPSVTEVNFWPSLDSAVTSGPLLNGYNAYVTALNEKSFSVQHAYVDSASAQEEFRGCHGKVKFVSALNELAMLECDFTASAGRDGALSLSTSPQASPLASGGHAIRNAIVYIQPATTSTREGYCVEEFAMEFDPGLEFIPCHGGAEGRAGVMRVKGRGSAKVTMAVRFDSDKDAEWASRSAQRILYAVPKGSGGGTRYVGLFAPSAELVRKPKAKKAGGRWLRELEYRLDVDSSAAENSIAGAPLVLFAV